MADVVDLIPKTAPAAAFACGDLVQLASGGATMTVKGAAPGKRGEPAQVTCCWHNEALDPVEETYAAPMIVRASGDQPE